MVPASRRWHADWRGHSLRRMALTWTPGTHTRRAAQGLRPCPCSASLSSPAWSWWPLRTQHWPPVGSRRSWPHGGRPMLGTRETPQATWSPPCSPSSTCSCPALRRQTGHGPAALRGRPFFRAGGVLVRQHVTESCCTHLAAHGPGWAESPWKRMWGPQPWPPCCTPAEDGFLCAAGEGGGEASSPHPLKGGTHTCWAGLLHPCPAVVGWGAAAQSQGARGQGAALGSSVKHRLL